MAYEWVAPVVTGIVGVVGVAGTFYSGKQSRDLAEGQQRHDVEQRTHGEKREVYVAYLEALNRALRTTDEAGRQANGSDGSAMRAARFEAMADIAFRREQLRLVGPPTVREWARLMGSHAQAILMTSAESETARRVEFDHQLSASLLAAMKQDLGYELASVDLAALTYSPPATVLARADHASAAPPTSATP